MGGVGLRKSLPSQESIQCGSKEFGMKTERDGRSPTEKEGEKK